MERDAGYSRKKLSDRIAFERSRDDADGYSGLGLRGAMPTEPTLCEASERARHCYLWCNGWHPEAWPLYAALYDVPDWHLLTDLMQHIRNHG